MKRAYIIQNTFPTPQEYFAHLSSQEIVWEGERRVMASGDGYVEIDGRFAAPFVETVVREVA